ncbi:hypothetical protein HG536_0B04480 [Torulaspora globosa]|uniref:C2 NT-type domain-containing protein n=1 Tax=Torulaspora globosa TaxID=48254 RepID=A0A7G3ZDJ8_9SACH|nr:uncharacterized protein HG536_0B04480 [Torulaspora globosa]QLL31584.1 hypothetical protein HG536_0B04480 [Torulaspora globosa]
MPLLNGKNKSKKPKFLLTLRINELINIPQSSGYCYVKWHLKEGTGTSTSGPIVDSNGEEIHVMNQSHGATPRIMVENHRARWNYEFERPLQIKMQVDRNRELISKVLLLEVFFEFLSDSEGNKPRRSNSGSYPAKSSPNNVYTQKATGKLLLGMVSLNLAEYVREDEQATTNRFLLKKSKVNSILNVMVQIKLIRGSYRDFLVSRSLVPGALRSGINDILDDSSDMGSSTSSAFQPSVSSPLRNKFSMGQRKTVGSSFASTERSKNFISASMSPLVDSLYQKTFQLPWDPRPGEFTPRECVEDILQGGNGWAKNEKGICLIDLQALRLNELESDYYDKHRIGQVLGSTEGDGSSVGQSATNYEHMDKREFLEKKQLWSRKSSQQRRSTQENEGINSKGCPEMDGYAEDVPNDRIRDARSWSVSNVIT